MLTSPTTGPVLGVSVVADEPEQPWRIVVRGLEPNRPVTIRARARDSANRLWESYAGFLADGGGVVDLERTQPVWGTYDSAGSLGLMRSLALDPAELSRGAQTPAPPLRVALTAEVDGRIVATSQLPGVEQVPG